MTISGSCDVSSLRVALQLLNFGHVVAVELVPVNVAARGFKITVQ